MGNVIRYDDFLSEDFWPFKKKEPAPPDPYEVRMKENMEKIRKVFASHRVSREWVVKGDVCETTDSYIIWQDDKERKGSKPTWKLAHILVPEDETRTVLAMRVEDGVVKATKDIKYATERIRYNNPTSAAQALVRRVKEHFDKSLRYDAQGEPLYMARRRGRSKPQE